jgi:hypothetical protein
MANRTTNYRCWAVPTIVVVLGTIFFAEVRAQEPEQPAETAEVRLDQIEARLAERYDRLELLAGRQAELSSSTQPRRAELLRQLIARGRERNVPGRFDDIITALTEESYSTAIESQGQLQTELEQLLELLLQEDRDRQLESERKRVLRYLQDLNRLIRLQRGVKARTDGGDDEQELADDQREVGDETQELRDEIDEQERESESNASENSEQNGEDSQGSSDQQNGNSEQEPSDPSESEPGDESESEPDDKDSGDENPSESDAESENESESESEQSADGQQGAEQQEGQPSEGQPSEGQQSESGQSGSSGESQPQQQSPMQRAAESLRQAQQRMQEAQERLEEAQREGAAEEQQRAVEELEQAKAEFERILRQLREEEMERMLVLLEARFRKMLDEQVAVYEETQKLDAASDNVPEHELEISAGRLGRREELIVREADRALVLLREDGTSVAFPEAVEQARDDMQAIAKRLNDAKVDLLTQTMEEDVIAALEETLAALQQALEELRQQQSQQPSGGAASPGEEPLVDQLAELRMIRALQLRVNRRTQQYGALVEGEQAHEADVLELLDELALRQAKIVQATRDLETESNR